MPLSKASSHRIAWATLILALSWLWGDAKNTLLESLAYCGDLFTFTQSARHAIEPGLFFFDHAYGWVSSIHNYFLLILIAPLAHYLGSWGTAFSSILLTAAASWLISEERAIPGRHRLGLVLCLWSPAAYYIFDNPIDGGQPDCLILPLSALCALSILKRSRIGSAICFIALIALREDGVIMATLIATGAVWLEGTTLPWTRKLKHSIVIALIGLGIFLAGLAYLGAQGPTLTGQDASSRLEEALRLLFSQWQGRPYRLLIIRSSISALLFGFVWVFLAARTRRVRTALLYLLGALPLLVLFAVANARYRGNAFYTPMWPPRLAYILGLAMALSVLSWARAPSFSTVSRWRFWPILIGILVFQTILLKNNRGYLVWDRVPPLLSLRKDAGEVSKLSESEKSGLKALSKAIPPGTPVLTDPALFGWFDRQSLLWPQESGFFRKPRWVICDSLHRFERTSSCSEFLSRYTAYGKLRKIGSFQILEIQDPNAPIPMNPKSPWLDQ